MHASRDPAILLAGFGWDGADEGKMRASFGLGRASFGAFVDLQRVASALGFCGYGLAGLVSRVLSLALPKPRSVSSLCFSLKNERFLVQVSHVTWRSCRHEDPMCISLHWCTVPSLSHWRLIRPLTRRAGHHVELGGAAAEPAPGQLRGTGRARNRAAAAFPPPVALQPCRLRGLPQPHRRPH